MSIGRIRENERAPRDLARDIQDITDVELQRALDWTRLFPEERREVRSSGRDRVRIDVGANRANDVRMGFLDEGVGPR